ncbi:uncharacterized protein STEHIDRAFT_152760 [Stereum hirsutum FP-91666 SS1]|uniref:uncharacterized protein n=1 Tax=Stereum hirsutum (strain FP-91666) TaxID=721885 RepID=UPI000440DCF3|nr:uncharacterized protein STEHIDRAFT_152760 [Stereum hirsutum FP-91666 SS1]EIM91086.1 hypothetical protein STEHIDRAFT_152760 [Stereum hirsutum FP-91666 SS1]
MPLALCHVSVVVANIVANLIDDNIADTPPSQHHRRRRRRRRPSPLAGTMSLSSDQVRFLFGMVVRELVYIGLVVSSFHLFFVPHLAYLLLSSSIVPHRSLPSSTIDLTYLDPPSSTITHPHRPSPILIDLYLHSQTLTHPRPPLPILTHP